MRFVALLLLVSLLAGLSPAMADAPLAAEPGPRTSELAEDLRILSILNTLQPSPEQLKELAAIAGAGKEGLAAIEAEVKVKLEQQRETLVAARETLLRGAPTPPAADGRLAAAGQSAESTRATRTEALIVSLTSRVRPLLTPEQASLIQNELASTADQPWRRYSRVPGGAGAAFGSAVRPPTDPAKWVKELRDLRALAAQGDPRPAVDAFVKKLVSGARNGTPLFDQSQAQARNLASQALSMPPNVFNQREWVLARAAAKQELDTRNQQRTLDGRPLPNFDAPRWLVEQVVLSPRASTTLRDRAAAP